MSAQDKKNNPYALPRRPYNREEIQTVRDAGSLPNSVQYPTKSNDALSARSVSSDSETYMKRDKNSTQKNMEVILKKGMEVPWVVRQIYEIQCLQDTLHSTGFFIANVSRFFNKRLISQIADSNGLAEIEMKPKDITVFFSDLRDFTSCSEKLDSESVKVLLSDYTTEFTHIIEGNDGALDKLIGDGVMGLYNATYPVNDHQLSGVLSALHCRDAMRYLNRRWKRKLKLEKPLGMGIGLHTGTANVGTFGSDDRISYTAIGDIVNAASRTESMNKMTGTDILITCDIYAKVRSTILCKKMGNYKVQGKEISLEIYAVVEELRFCSEADIKRCELYTSATDLFIAGRFGEAHALYTEYACITTNGFEEKACKDKLAKCKWGVEQLVAGSVLSSFWHGVEDADSK
jgi:class 3 adenylate cyclase